jgi:hypothetical protein
MKDGCKEEGGEEAGCKEEGREEEEVINFFNRF